MGLVGFGNRRVSGAKRIQILFYRDIFCAEAMHEPIKLLQQRNLNDGEGFKMREHAGTPITFPNLLAMMLQKIFFLWSWGG